MDAEIPSRVEHEGPPVKYLVVLSANHVEIGERKPRFHDPRDHVTQPFVVFAPAIGRTVRNQQDLGPGFDQGLANIRVPCIFADRRSQPDSRDFVGAADRSRHVMPLLVKDIRVRKMMLEQAAVNPSTNQDMESIVKVTIPEKWRPDSDRRPFGRPGGKRLDHVHRVTREGGFENEILHLISRHEHLGQQQVI